MFGPVGSLVGGAGAGVAQGVSELGEKIGLTPEGTPSLPALLANSDNGALEFVGQMAGGVSQEGISGTRLANAMAAAEQSAMQQDPQLFAERLSELGLPPSAASEVADEYQQAVALQTELWRSGASSIQIQNEDGTVRAPESEQEIAAAIYQQTLMSVPEVIAQQEAQQEAIDRAAAYQMAAAEFMAPYTQAAYDRSNATAQMYRSLIPNMPAAYQPVAQAYATDYQMGQQQLADMYASQSRMIPYLGAIQNYTDTQAAIAAQQQQAAQQVDPAALAAMQAGV
jgi:hypothetical protein